MNTTLLETLLANYQWRLSIVAGVAIIATSIVIQYLAMLVPAFREASRLNRAVFREKMRKPHYAANQAWNRKWSLPCLVVIFGLILPFCITADAQPAWKIVTDIIVILMFYDFVYYLTHRFLFHDSAFFGGPLLWVHAVHHRQHNPCRKDSSYIHPIEVAIGLGLYIGSVFVLSRFIGNFHLLTIVVTWIAFLEINLHNHDRWQVDHFPFKYLNYASVLHHHHHAKFTGGNFATISPLYDWMFGTLDHGAGYRALRQRIKQVGK
jgi:sterol desaturase/sphingolipid hydroxylase (fatty acid hydroxylase superfamily)